MKSVAALLEGLAGDPQAFLMATEAKAAQSDREVVKLARDAASRDKEAAMERAIQAEKTAAVVGLVSGLTQALSKAASGVEQAMPVGATDSLFQKVVGKLVELDVVSKIEPCQYLVGLFKVDKAAADKDAEQNRKIEGDLSAHLQGLRDQAKQAAEAVRRIVDAEHALRMAVVGRA
jgi:hypothetical protein